MTAAKRHGSFSVWQKSLRSTSPWLIINRKGNLQKLALGGHRKTELLHVRLGRRALRNFKLEEIVDVYLDREYVTLV